MGKGQKIVIAELTRDELKPGRVGQLFHKGVRAIHLQGDDRIAALWSELVLTPTEGTRRAFWQRGIADFARNHSATEMDVGDILRFCPGLFGHIARKTILYQEEGDQDIKMIPEYFWCEGERESWPQDILRVAWELASDIFKSVLPPTFNYPYYAVGLELLKYPSCLVELENIFNLLADSSGGWARIGQQMDTYKAMAEGLLDRKILRDLFALGSLVPGLRQSLHAFNQSLRPFSRYQVPDDAHIIGPPHTDASRTISCLGGDRDRITTEIYDGHQWHKLGFTPDSLYVFPSDALSNELNFEPTIHRYSTTKDRTYPVTDKPNVTLMIGIVNKNYFKPLAQNFR